MSRVRKSNSYAQKAVSLAGPSIASADSVCDNVVHSTERKVALWPCSLAILANDAASGQSGSEINGSA